MPELAYQYEESENEDEDEEETRNNIKLIKNMKGMIRLKKVLSYFYKLHEK